MKKSGFKWFLLGVALTLTISAMTTPLLGADVSLFNFIFQKVSVKLEDQTITFAGYEDGVTKTKQKAGERITPFVLNDVIYAPVDALAYVLGYNTTLSKDKKTINIEQKSVKEAADMLEVMLQKLSDTEFENVLYHADTRTIIVNYITKIETAKDSKTYYDDNDSTKESWEEFLSSVRGLFESIAESVRITQGYSDINVVCNAKSLDDIVMISCLNGLVIYDITRHGH